MLTQGFDCLQRGAMPDIHTDHWRYRTKSSPSEALMFCLLVALDSDRKQTFVVILRPRMKKKRKKQERYYNSKCTFRITTQSNESHSGLRYLRTGASMVQRQSTWHLWCSAFPVYIYSPTTSLCFVYWADGATDNSRRHQWTAFPVSSMQHPRGMLCLVLSVLPHQCYSSEVGSRRNYSRVHTRNLTEFVSASLWLDVFVPRSWSLWIYVTLMTILILTN